MIDLFIFIKYLLTVYEHTILYIALAFLIIYFARITDSRTKIFIFVLSLIKPFFIIVRLADVNRVIPFKIYSFFNFFNTESADFYRVGIYREIYFYLIINILIISFFAAFIVITAVKIYQTYGFFYKYRKRGEITDCKDDYINTNIDLFSKMFSIKKPDVFLTSKYKIYFYSFGIRKKRIILNSEIFLILNEKEKQTVLMHEIAHMKRNDGILNALISYLLELNYFNPFVYLPYAYIKNEQEKACDKLVLQYSGISPKELAVNILTSIIKIKKFNPEFKKQRIGLNSCFISNMPFFDHLIKARIKSLMKTSPEKMSLVPAARAALYALFVFALAL